MKRWSIPIVALFVWALVISSAYASSPTAGTGGGRGHAMDNDLGYGARAMQALSLTADQKAKLESMRTAFWKDTKSIRDQLFIKGGDLKMLWLEAKPDEAKIKALQKEIGALRDQLQDKTTSYRLAVLNVLTPEQQNKLRSFFMRAHWGKGPGMEGQAAMCEGSGPVRGGK